jgi:hypothetical protein
VWKNQNSGEAELLSEDLPVPEAEEQKPSWDAEDEFGAVKEMGGMYAAILLLRIHSAKHSSFLFNVVHGLWMWCYRLGLVAEDIEKAWHP